MSDPREDKLREHFASGTADEVPVDTLEFSHPSFVAEDGVTPAAARFVNDPHDDAGFDATLEDDAPMNAGETVNFACGQFDAQLPDQNTTGLPTCQISVDNVTRQLMPLLKLAAQNPAPIGVIYRCYVASDTLAPAQIVTNMTMKNANASFTRVTANIGFDDFLGKPFLTSTYNHKDHPGLDR